MLSYNDALNLADTHPEIMRMRAMPDYLTDPVFHLQVVLLRESVVRLFLALSAEGVDREWARRIVARVVYGSPNEDTAAAAAAARDAAARRADIDAQMRVDHLDPSDLKSRPRTAAGTPVLRPGDIVSEVIPIRVEGPGAEGVARKIADATTPAKQMDWLLCAGCERPITGPAWHREPGETRRRHDVCPLN